ncbi:hypothetical protein LX32DRAFT_177117 [Colletotrichum zoysiae]|uniref:Uncharacterized protein n=1 Tax=Colletotrichum zoysiae TaxID=1216348 RepID=A0AAD9LVM6_9PEZI|nr:hypothetical protein LX32DRAFT_177117 [Colletotrichum zoysiae]
MSNSEKVSRAGFSSWNGLMRAERTNRRWPVPTTNPRLAPLQLGTGMTRRRPGSLDWVTAGSDSGVSGEGAMTRATKISWFQLFGNRGARVDNASLSLKTTPWSLGAPCLSSAATYSLQPATLVPTGSDALHDGRVGKATGGTMRRRHAGSCWQPNAWPGLSRPSILTIPRRQGKRQRETGWHRVYIRPF